MDVRTVIIFRYRLVCRYTWVPKGVRGGRMGTSVVLPWTVLLWSFKGSTALPWELLWLFLGGVRASVLFPSMLLPWSYLRPSVLSWGTSVVLPWEVSPRFHDPSMVLPWCFHSFITSYHKDESSKTIINTSYQKLPLTRVTKSYLSALGTTQISSYITKH